MGFWVPIAVLPGPLRLWPWTQDEKMAICPQRGGPWMFCPEAPYERGGDLNHVVFPCGQTIGADGDTIHLYYGAADSTVALAATGSIRCLLTWLDANFCPGNGSGL